MFLSDNNSRRRSQELREKWDAAWTPKKLGLNKISQAVHNSLTMQTIDLFKILVMPVVLDGQRKKVAQEHQLVVATNKTEGRDSNMLRIVLVSA